VLLNQRLLPKSRPELLSPAVEIGLVEIPQHKVALACGIVLILIYLIALFADFLPL